MCRSAVVLLLAAIAGCAASTNQPRDAWNYTGRDPSLLLPQSRANGLSAEAFQRQGQEEFAAWRLRFDRARDRARSACARETGQSEEPSLWTGYDGAMLDCMRARDWVRAHGGNPL